eukprot:3588886-Rhodomonas_salina.2
MLAAYESKTERRNPNTKSSVCLQLLNGDTMYHGHLRKIALQKMLGAGGDGELEACWIVQARGKQMYYPFSDLENIKYTELLAESTTTEGLTRSTPEESTAPPVKKRKLV